MQVKVHGSSCRIRIRTTIKYVRSTGIGDGAFQEGSLKTVPDGHFYSLQLSSKCTVSSIGVVKFLGAGECTLTAHVTATTNYAAATRSPQSFTIAQATTPIKIKNIPSNAKKGGSFTPTYTYVGDGAPSTVSSTPAICIVAGSIVNFSASGTCTLTAQATAGTNYKATAGSPKSFAIK